MRTLYDTFGCNFLSFWATVLRFCMMLWYQILHHWSKKNWDKEVFLVNLFDIFFIFWPILMKFGTYDLWWVLTSNISTFLKYSTSLPLTSLPEASWRPLLREKQRPTKLTHFDIKLDSNAICSLLNNILQMKWAYIEPSSCVKSIFMSR